MTGRFKTFLPSILGGVLYGLAFPKTNLSWAAWVALIPLLVTCLEGDVKDSTLNSLLFGAAANTFIFYWVFPTCRAAQVNIPVSLLACGLLVIYHTLYFVGFALCMAKTAPLRFFWPFQAAAWWVTLEFLRAHALSGFPWSLLAHTQWKNLPVLQIAELTGPYGVSFLIVLVNAALAVLFSQRLEGQERPRSLLYPGVILALALFWGAIRLDRFSPSHLSRAPRLSVAILQGNIDQYQKWDNAYEEGIRKTYDDLLNVAMKSRPDLVVWPETAVPGWFPNEARVADWVSREAAKARTFELIGAPTTEAGEDFNAAFLISPQGFIKNRYSKIHLVPFGEYVPFRKWLAPWVRVLNEMGNFSSGRKAALFQIPGGSFAASICFEAIFPDLISSFHEAGAQFLVNITNDGWFLDTSAPQQHMVANVLRAVENRTFVVRAANTGISCIIEPSGEIQSQTPLLTKAVLLGQVFSLSNRTPYNHLGNLFAWLCVTASLGGFLSHRKPA